MKTTDIRKRIFSKIIVSDSGCWEWQEGKRHGYGYVWFEGKIQYTHRVVWKLFIAPLTSGLTIDHLCRNRACCNPHHLEEVSLKKNILRGEGACAKNARKTHCLRGHRFDKDNTIMIKSGRSCRKCQNYANKLYRRRLKCEL